VQRRSHSSAGFAANVQMQQRWPGVDVDIIAATLSVAVCVSTAHAMLTKTMAHLRLDSR
jgi:hypothetical protein